LIINGGAPLKRTPAKPETASICALTSAWRCSSPFSFKALPGVGHLAADQVPGRVSELLLQHVAAYSV
jgi:hypothetical protein